jgi:replication-associated recombination protein RarA
MIKNLLWEKYRPQSLDDLILLPRIHKIVDGGIDNNLILYGHYGTGKTTLAKILTKDKPTLYMNTSLDTSIDNLREDIQNHVNTISDIFNPLDTFKYVFLDEFEEASSKYQNALKAFIEDYADVVRFIFVTNHIHKVEKGIISRSTRLDFDPQTDDEIKYWKTKCKERLIHISKEENIDIDEISIKRIVNHNFPDLRNMIVILSEVKRTGNIDYTLTNFDSQLKINLYNNLKNNNIVELQEFIMNNFGPEKIQELFNLCGRPLLETLVIKDRGILETDKLGDIYSLVSEHSMWLNTIKGGDPVVVGTSCLHNIKKILNK